MGVTIELSSVFSSCCLARTSSYCIGDLTVIRLELFLSLEMKTILKTKQGYPIVVASNLVGSSKSFATGTGLGGVTSGVPRTDNNPFILPNTNTKRNTDRFMQITVVLRQYSEMILPSENTVLALYISNLFSYIDNLYNRSPH